MRLPREVVCGVRQGVASGLEGAGFLQGIGESVAANIIWPGIRGNSSDWLTPFTEGGTRISASPAKGLRADAPMKKRKPALGRLVTMISPQQADS